MTERVVIAQENSFSSSWIRVFIPLELKPGGVVSISDRQGAILKKVSVHPGNNAIDISQVREEILSIKVETVYETVLKEIVRTDQHH